MAPPTRRFTALLAGLLMSAGCRPAPETHDSELEFFRDDGLGLGFELPAGWVSRRDGQRFVLSGPRGGEGHFTTVSIQPVSTSNGAPLGSVLASMYEAAATYPHFDWDTREPASIGGRPAVRYGLQFELHEKQRRKLGYLIDTGRHVIDLSYSATTELFPLGVPAFELIVGSLWTY